MARAKAGSDKTKAKRRKAKPVSIRPAPAADEREAARSTGEEVDSVRWEQRSDKDAYALDLLERLVRYFTGRAQATNNEATHAAAAVLSTVSLGLAADDEELLTRLWQAAREIRR